MKAIDTWNQEIAQQVDDGGNVRGDQAPNYQDVKLPPDPAVKGYRAPVVQKGAVNDASKAATYEGIKA
jgi:hypothetical protein